MCGIFGIVNGSGNKNSIEIVNWANNATYVGSVRGSDSTGMFQVMDGKGKQPIYSSKLVGDGSTFLKDQWADSIIKDADKAFITIGHHRSATKGDISENTAHPFEFDRKDGSTFIGVHNGTLSTYMVEEDGKKFFLDSDWAIYRLSKDVLGNLKAFSGPFAFAFYDSSEPDKFFMTTNGQRPLHWAFIEGQNRMLVASEPMMLAWLAERNSLKIEKRTVYSAIPNLLYTFPEGDLRKYTRMKYKEDAVTTETGSSSKSTSFPASHSAYRPSQDVLPAAPRESYEHKAIRETVIAVRGMSQQQVNDEIKRITTPISLTTPVSRVPITGVSPITHVGTGVTQEEFKFLKESLNLLYNSEAEFVAEGWDELTRTVYGLVDTTDLQGMKETYVAEIRGVDKHKWRSLDASKIRVRVIGGTMFTPPNSKLLEIKVFCRLPIAEAIQPRPIASAK